MCVLHDRYSQSNSAFTHIGETFSFYKYLLGILNIFQSQIWIKSHQE